MRLHEIYNGERSKIEDILETTQQLLGMSDED